MTYNVSSGTLSSTLLQSSQELFKFFKVTCSKVKVTETFSGGGVTIDGSPLTSA